MPRRGAPSNNPNGRPLKPVDERQLVALASIGCTLDEMSAILDVNKEVLIRRFNDKIKKAQETMRMSLRRYQLRLAEQGNATMCIWLGKQYLGQSDKTEIYQEIKDVRTLTDEQLEALLQVPSRS